ncbi:MAG TPA: site-specific DNA-methyltransferase [Chloroflexota bacterium]|jgi:site-specific DNA-methyltransferase (adenine-specific)|nr:site-specific DNA-methyltransferase [Chloroflexota bacterium]
MTGRADVATRAIIGPEVKIEQRDCLEFLNGLPDSSVDIIVTDPAYSGMNQHMRFGRGRIVGEYRSDDNPRWFREFHDDPITYRHFLAECCRVLRPNRHLYVMFDSYSLLTLGALVRDYFAVKSVIVWDKVKLGMGHYFRRRHEFVVFATKGARKLSRRDLPDVWRFRRIHPPRYPTQKPVELFEAMLAGSVEPGDVVCDPFVGSGSSAIAALRRRCRFVGCDISARAVSFCAERLSEFQETGLDPAQPSSALVEGDQYDWLLDSTERRRSAVVYRRSPD